MKRYIMGIIFSAFSSVIDAGPLNTVTVDADSDWVDSGVVLSRSSNYVVVATGFACWNTLPEEKWVGPEGTWQTGDARTLIPGPLGALVGRIGSVGTPFFLGSIASMQGGHMLDEGSLYLRFNDSSWSDNVGFYDVEIWEYEDYVSEVGPLPSRRDATQDKAGKTLLLPTVMVDGNQRYNYNLQQIFGPLFIVKQRLAQ